MEVYVFIGLRYRGRAAGQVSDAPEPSLVGTRLFHIYTRNTIFAVTREAEGKGFLANTILLSPVLRRRKSVHYTILHTRLQWIESVLGHFFSGL